MFTYIYLIIALFCLLVAFSLVQIRMFYLNKHPDKYLPAYDGHEVFLDRFFLVIRFFVKKIAYLFKRAYRNLLHF